MIRDLSETVAKMGTELTIQTKQSGGETLGKIYQANLKLANLLKEFELTYGEAIGCVLLSSY